MGSGQRLIDGVRRQGRAFGVGHNPGVSRLEIAIDDELVAGCARKLTERVVDLQDAMPEQVVETGGSPIHGAGFQRCPDLRS